MYLSSAGVSNLDNSFKDPNSGYVINGFLESFGSSGYSYTEFNLISGINLQYSLDENNLCGSLEIKIDNIVDNLSITIESCRYRVIKIDGVSYSTLLTSSITTKLTTAEITGAANYYCEEDNKKTFIMLSTSLLGDNITITQTSFDYAIEAKDSNY